MFYWLQRMFRGDVRRDIICVVDNQQIAIVFSEIADMLDIRGDNSFRVGAYRRAAQTIDHLSYDLRDVYAKRRDIGKIFGIGPALKEKIIEMITKGRCGFYDELVKSFPKGVLAMLRVRGIGPKKVKLFFGTLGIHTLAQLKSAAVKGKLRDLPKMGVKSEQDILRAIEEFEAMPHDRRLLHEALMEAHAFVLYMRRCSGVVRVEYAGSLRRGMDTIGDIDILVAAKEKDHARIMAYVGSYSEVQHVLSRGDTKSSVLLASGVQVDVRVISESIFGAALHYFTGSKAHNIRIRDRAKKMGLKVSEYGVFRMRGKKETLIAGRTEEEVFAAVKLPYIIPEMREDRGEVEYADRHKKMFACVDLDDLRGDLHTHSTWSDGSENIETMAQAYKNAGFSYMALTDHCDTIGITRGMSEARIRKQWKEVELLNKMFAPFRILKGSEVDILKDGRLAYPDAILEELEIVCASAHLHHQLPEIEQTKRLIRAIESGYVQILSHPTGRLIHERKGLSFNMEAVFKACKDHRVALEINCSPSRMDLNDVMVRAAREVGCKLVISTDAHHSSHVGFLPYGVLTARRAWLQPQDILNTLPVSELLAFWKKK